MAKKYVKSRPGLFGMVYYYDENGRPLGKSRPGLIEGTRVYTDQNGGYAGKSRKGFLSKAVYKDTNHNYITSYDSLCGEIHFQNGAPIGHSRPGWFGASHTALEIEEEICDSMLYEEEVDSIADFLEERFEESADEQCEGSLPQSAVCTAGGKVKCFIFFLAICALIVYISVMMQ